MSNQAATGVSNRPRQCGVQTYAANCLEPMGATALVKDGRVEVWCSTQNGEGTLAVAAASAGVQPDKAEVHKMQVGGGFGRRGGSQDFTRLAVQIARTMEGTPVKSLWTREEDTQHDFYRPAALYRLKAGLDAGGNPIGWYTRIAAPSIFATLLKLPLKDGIDSSMVEGFSEFPYGIPNVRNEYAQRDTHVPVGFWRTVGWSQNPFARECFLDEVAAVAGKEPYEFRRTLLAAEKSEHSGRALGILDAVAKAAGWRKPLPPGRLSRYRRNGAVWQLRRGRDRGIDERKAGIESSSSGGGNRLRVRRESRQYRGAAAGISRLRAHCGGAR
ncbi:MAG: molybdopterin cofactor-binding domain-containing protein [Gammaproteobacteria bacterium]